MRALRIGNQIDKFRGFFKLRAKYQIIIAKYILERILGRDLNSRDKDFYRYFNYLIWFDGKIIIDKPEYLVGRFNSISQEHIKLRKLPSSDFDVFHQIFFWNEYSPVLDLYEQYFGPVKEKKINIIDAGSNIGLTTRFFINHINSANIICLEPDIENFKILDFNISETRSHNIKKLNAALWSKNTKVEVINDFRDRSDWAKRVKEVDSEGGITAFTLSELLKDNKWNLIDILKIDIEGGEKEIFNPRKSDLSFLNITKCLAIEIHDEFNCRLEINKILEEYGFRYYKKGELTIAINQDYLN